jgi:hypothetical protein
MSRPTIAAAILMLATAGIHVFAGQPQVHAAIQASDLHPILRAISSVLWHAVTVQLLAFTAALLWVARHPNRAVSLLIATICLSYTALFLWIGTTMLQSPWPMPQWTLFAALAALTLWGAKPATPA